MKPYVIYRALICLFVFETFYGLQIVKQCPLDITSWHKRSTDLDCDAKGLSYHCILTYNATLYEICIDGKIYEGNRIGCPWIHFHNNEPVFGAKNSKCPTDLVGCPPKEHVGYESDQLFLYPMCFVPEKDRLQIRTNVTVTYIHDTERKKPDDSDSNIVKIYVIAFMSVIIILILCFLGILYLRRRIKHTEKDNAAEPKFVDSDNEAEHQFLEGGDSEMRPVPMKQLRNQFASVCKYNCIQHYSCQYHRKPKIADSETRIVIFKCAAKWNLQLEIEAFKYKISDRVPEDTPFMERIFGFHFARYRFQNMIAVFIDVNESTVDIVRDFTRLLQKCCCVATCIALSNDKDVFLNTNEMLHTRGRNINNVDEDLSELQRGEEEYTIVDASELKKEYPLVYHIAKYITHQTGTEPDSRFCHDRSSFVEIKERL